MYIFYGTTLFYHISEENVIKLLHLLFFFIDFKCTVNIPYSFFCTLIEVAYYIIEII